MKPHHALHFRRLILLSAVGLVASLSAASPAVAAGPSAASSAARPLNISTRMQIGAGDDVLIGGFVIDGTAPKRVILRAIGPSLSAAGIANPLADPFMELHASDRSLITTNDNWKDSAAADIEATGLAPTNVLESAIIITLDPGTYTVIVRGKDGATGVGMVEVYEVGQSAGSQLDNLSARGRVGTGSNVMVGGFVLGGGDGNARLLIRALGPSLAPSGLQNVLADPTLELRDENGAVVSRNDNWRLSPQASAIEASGLQPSNDLEPAILETLAPGAYTAVVSGQAGLTGIALLDVYRLP
ncbi:MAG TPA: hypothetical protein VGF73_04415 [Chthoniobacterales bacterium]